MQLREWFMGLTYKLLCRASVASAAIIRGSEARVTVRSTRATSSQLG